MPGVETSGCGESGKSSSHGRQPSPRVNLEVRPDQAEKFSDLELVNLLGVSLPFHPAEKQALLEAATLKDRETMLVDLLRLGAGPEQTDLESAPRTLN